MDKRALIKWYQENGVDAVSSIPTNFLETPVQTVRKPQPKAPQPVAKTTAPQAIPAQSTAPKPTTPAVTSLSHIKTLQELQQALETFDGCDLKKTATNTVFSDGASSAKIMIVGEAPGADEDRQGKPFVGLSGQLLDLMLASIGLSREKNVYITNTIPWRPPGNRTPTPYETNTCLAFLHRHIELIQPDLILLVGGVSAKTLLETKDSLSKLRGKVHTFKTHGESKEIKAYPLFHPAYLLRSPGQKRNAWKDLLKLKAYIQEHKICDL